MIPWIVACSVCFSSYNSQATREAFLGTTVFMSTLPVFFVASVIGGFWWRSRRQGP